MKRDAFWLQVSQWILTDVLGRDDIADDLADFRKRSGISDAAFWQELDQRFARAFGKRGGSLPSPRRKTRRRQQAMIAMLNELAEAWDVEITSVGRRAWAGREWRLVLHGSVVSHTYRGIDLQALVARAWAGEPSDEERRR